MGAFVDGDMAAYAIVCLEDGWLHFLIQRSHYRYSEFFPRQVLEFTVAKHAALEGRVKACSLGLSTLDPDSGWDDMNSQLGFEWEPHSMVVRLHPALEPVVRSRLLGGVARRVAMSADGHGGGQEAGILLDAARRSRLAEAMTAASRLAPSPDRRTRALLALNAAQQASVAKRRRLLLQAPAEAAMRNETHEDLIYWNQGG